MADVIRIIVSNNEIKQNLIVVNSSNNNYDYTKADGINKNVQSGILDDRLDDIDYYSN